MDSNRLGGCLCNPSEISSETPTFVASVNRLGVEGCPEVREQLPISSLSARGPGRTLEPDGLSSALCVFCYRSTAESITNGAVDVLRYDN